MQLRTHSGTGCRPSRSRSRGRWAGTSSWRAQGRECSAAHCAPRTTLRRDPWTRPPHQRTTPDIRQEAPKVPSCPAPACTPRCGDRPETACTRAARGLRKSPVASHSCPAMSMDTAPGGPGAASASVRRSDHTQGRAERKTAGTPLHRHHVIQTAERHADAAVLRVKGRPTHR